MELPLFLKGRTKRIESDKQTIGHTQVEKYSVREETKKDELQLGISRHLGGTEQPLLTEGIRTWEPEVIPQKKLLEEEELVISMGWRIQSTGGGNGRGLFLKVKRQVGDDHSNPGLRAKVQLRASVRTTKGRELTQHEAKASGSSGCTQHTTREDKGGDTETTPWSRVAGPGWRRPRADRLPPCPHSSSSSGARLLRGSVPTTWFYFSGVLLSPGSL